MTARTGMSKCLILRTGITYQPSHSPDDPFSDRTLNSPLTLSYDLSYAWGFFFFSFFQCSAYWKSEDDVGSMAGLGGDADSHPYVSFTINLV